LDINNVLDLDAPSPTPTPAPTTMVKEENAQESIDFDCRH
jgi:hypothetical protein